MKNLNQINQIGELFEELTLEGMVLRLERSLGKKEAKKQLRYLYENYLRKNNNHSYQSI